MKCDVGRLAQRNNDAVSCSTSPDLSDEMQRTVDPREDSILTTGEIEEHAVRMGDMNITPEAPSKPIEIGLQSEADLIPDVESTKGEVADWSCKARLRDTAVPCAVQQEASTTPLEAFSWVRHVTIPPGCILPAGAEFTKTWALKHFVSGQELPSKEIRLVHKSEGVLGGACQVPLLFNRVDIQQGSEFEVSIHGLVVPDTPGQEIVEVWRFEDDAGVQYGQPLRVRSVNLYIVIPLRTEGTSFMVAPKSDESSLNSSAVIMPQSTSSNSTNNQYQTPPTSSSDVDEVESVDSDSTVDSFIDVEGVTTASGTMTSNEQEMEDFDFVDEIEG